MADAGGQFLARKASVTSRGPAVKPVEDTDSARGGNLGDLGREPIPAALTYSSPVRMPWLARTSRAALTYAARHCPGYRWSSVVEDDLGAVEISVPVSWHPAPSNAASRRDIALISRTCRGVWYRKGLCLSGQQPTERSPGQGPATPQNS